MYLSFMTWTKKTAELGGMTYFNETWFPKHDEICKKWDVKLLKRGIPFGTVETYLFVYETDLELSKYQDFRGEVVGIESDLIEYTNTTIVNCPN